MATGAVTAAPKESGLQKVETIFTDIGKVLQDTENVVINVGASPAAQGLLTKFLPPAVAGPVNQAMTLAANTFAALEAQEAQIGAGKLPYASKVAIIVGAQGAEIAKLLATAGLSALAGDVQQVVNTATGVGALNWATITQAPAPAPAPAPPATGGASS